MESWSELADSEMEDTGEERFQDNSLSSQLSASPPLSANWSHTSNSDASVTASSIHLPPIHTKPVTVLTGDRGAAASAINLPRRLSAPEADIRSHGQWLNGPRQAMAEQLQTDGELSPEKHGQVSFNQKGLDSLVPTLDNLTVHDADVDESVLRRTEMYRHRGRRYSLPLANSPRNKTHQSSLVVHPEKHDEEYDLRQSRASTDKTRTKLPVAEPDESQTFTSRLEYYKRLGRRYSLPHHSSLLDGRMKLLNESLHEGESPNKSRASGGNTSPVDEEFHPRGESLTNSTGLTGNNDEASRRAQRYIHRGRRFSLPPPNCLASGHSEHISASNCTQGMDTSLRANNRPPTPIAGSLNWKHVGWHSNGILSKSTECIANIQPVPPTGTLQTAAIDAPVPWRDEDRTTIDKPKTDGRRVKRGTRHARAPTGVTWETAATHKTFSFVYNDDSNKSEMVSPPLVGGVVLKTVRVDPPPTESVSPGPEQPTHTLYPNTVNNNIVPPKVQTPSALKPVPPTVQILKDSWRRENEQEKAFRILQWILSEQAQRTNEMDAQNLN